MFTTVCENHQGIRQFGSTEVVVGRPGCPGCAGRLVPIWVRGKGADTDFETINKPKPDQPFYTINCF